jgi:hypothetical protein
VIHANAPMPADALQIRFDQHGASVSKNRNAEMIRVKIWRSQNRHH